ncbi:DPP IV N-terminal domain-containing protein [Streptomyces sp. JNUCC 64]
MLRAYQRAAALHPYRHHELIFRDQIDPVWEGDSFWYRVSTPDGPEFVRVHPERGEREVIADPGVPKDPSPRPTGENRSPDRRYTLTFDGDDLAVNGKAVTTDGVPGHDYAKSSDIARTARADSRDGKTRAPLAAWSPDGRNFVTCRVDQRHVPLLTMTESCPPDGRARPDAYTLHYEMPGGPLPTVTHLIVDAETGGRTDVRLPPLPFSHEAPLGTDRVWWSDENTIWFLYETRGAKAARLYRVDAGTGTATLVLEETADTIMESAPSRMDPLMVRVHGEEVLWYSTRDGWGHLYLYRDGELVTQVTGGDWLVREIVHLDWTERQVTFLASGLGDDPYQRTLCRVGLDGSGLTRLTPSDTDHIVRASPDGRWFVDTHAGPQDPPVTVLLDHDGRPKLELERADVSRLVRAGWRAPEPFTALAADGTTELHGLLYLPGDFDPTASYPILDSVYNGPQVTRQVRIPDKGLDPYLLDPVRGAPSLAALGFAVVIVDGRGTPYRSKAFHDAGHGDPGLAVGLADHVAVIGQLAAERPYLDAGRVGITGHSGGGAATAGAMLRHPDVFSVGVASAGNYENAGYYAIWAETYGGAPPYDYDQWSLRPLADRLRGKLLMIFGEMDENTHPALSLQLADALIRADRDVDMLVVPGATHSYRHAEAHVERRTWDYLVRHLLGEEPPPGFRLELPQPPR